MHAIRTTLGFVIDSRPYSEAGKILSIFTRDLGLVSAVATGIRFEKSKLRYHVQNYSFGTYSLVRGKELWRLTSAASERPENIGSVDTDISLLGNSSCSRQSRSQGPLHQHSPATRVATELAARISLLLRRLLQGEESHPELFDIVRSCLSFAEIVPDMTNDQLKALESLTVLRILHSLGYIGKEPQFIGCLTSSEITTDLIEKSSVNRILMNKHINNALKESHL